jgi:hypothetical protein
MTPGRDAVLTYLATFSTALPPAWMSCQRLDGIAGSQGEYRDKGEYPIQSLHDCVLASNKFMTSRAMP